MCFKFFFLKVYETIFLCLILRGFKTKIQWKIYDNLSCDNEKCYFLLDDFFNFFFKTHMKEFLFDFKIKGFKILNLSLL